MIRRPGAIIDLTSPIAQELGLSVMRPMESVVGPMERELRYVSLVTGVEIRRYSDDRDLRPTVVTQQGPDIPHAHRRMALFHDSARTEAENDALARQALTMVHGAGLVRVTTALLMHVADAWRRTQEEQRETTASLRQLSAVVASQQDLLAQRSMADVLAPRSLRENWIANGPKAEAVTTPTGA